MSASPAPSETPRIPPTGFFIVEGLGCSWITCQHCSFSIAIPDFPLTEKERTECATHSLRHVPPPTSDDTPPDIDVRS